MELVNNSSSVSTFILEDTRFKSSIFTVRLLLPLKEETVTENAMAASLITDTSSRYKTPDSMSKALANLYGSSISSATEKLGDNQLITISLRCLDDSFGMNGEKCFTKALHILYDMLFSPNLENGVFTQTDVDRKKRMWADKIEGEINDKRIYAKNRLESIMYEGEPYGISKNGYIKNVKAVAPENLTLAYRRIIEESKIRINFIGATKPIEMIEKFKNTFEKFPNRHTPVITPTKKRAPVTVTERLDVTQGKLVMGFSAELSGDDETTYPLQVAADIFGGGTYSRLFSSVREKQSLCYYCSAHPTRIKGLVLVESGIENENAQKAQNAILKELDDLKAGNFDDSVIEASKKSLSEALSAMYDKISSLDYWYGSSMIYDNVLSPSEYLERINKVTKADVLKALNGINLAAVYYLLSKGGDQ